jgi:hypothetical protein
MAGTTTYFGISYPTSTDYVKDGASNMQTIATGFDSAIAIPTYNAQTGTTYTFALSDIGKVVTASNASASTYTIPAQTTVTWVTGTTLTLTNLGAGVVTIAGAGTVTVTNTAQTVAQYQTVKLIRTASNAWTVVPQSGASGGLTLIKTQTIGSAVSTVTVSNAFSSTYDNYKVQIAGGVASVADANINMTLGATATGYKYGLTHNTYGTGTNSFGSAAAAFWTIGIGQTNSLNMNADIISPNLAKLSYFGAFNVYTGSAGFSAGYLNNTTQYTDFTIVPSTGTLTGGTIFVYGYQKS